jgi:propanol-preferring alcohol dehydrogenase
MLKDLPGRKLGGVRHMGVQSAKAMGMRVVGVDGEEEKRELCMRLGCKIFVDLQREKMLWRR